MQKKIQHLFLLGAIFSLLPFSLSANVEGPVVVVIHPSKSMDDMSLSELCQIYQGRRNRRPDGQKIMAVNLTEDSEIKKIFYHRILDSLHDRDFFVPGSPIPFRTSAKISLSSAIRHIPCVPNTIGYIPLNGVGDRVKVLTLDHLSLSMKGYILE